MDLPPRHPRCITPQTRTGQACLAIGIAAAGLSFLLFYVGGATLADAPSCLSDGCREAIQKGQSIQVIALVSAVLAGCLATVGASAMRGCCCQHTQHGKGTDGSGA